MAIESEAEVFENGEAVFAESGDVAADAGVATSAFERAKAAGDLDPDFHHAEGPFGFIVGEGQVRLPQEGEDAILVTIQAIQQVLCLGLFEAFPGSLLGRDGVGPAACPQDIPVLPLPAAKLLFRRGRISGFEGPDPFEHFQEQIMKVFSPRLLMLFEEEDQFAQQVAFAEGVQTVVESQIAGEKVMHQPTGELGNDPNGLDGFLAAVEMDGKERQQGRAKDMEPMVDLVYRHAGLVGVKDRFLGQDLHQPVFKGLQRLVLFLPDGLQGGFTDGITEHLRAHLTDPQAGALLGVVEVGEQSAEVFPILDRSFEVGGKGRHADLLATGALLDLGPMLGAFELEGRQIENLAPLKIHGRLPGEVLAARTLQTRVNL